MNIFLPETTSCICKEHTNQNHSFYMLGARVSPPGDSLIYCRAFTRRHEWTNPMSSYLRDAAKDRARRLSARSSHIGGF